MPNWKKIIQSGSSATLASLTVDDSVTAGSFIGNGSGLTNLPNVTIPSPLVIGDSPTQTVLTPQPSYGNLRISNGYGYCDIGPRSTTLNQFKTDATRHYFDKEILIDTGKVSSYNEDLVLRRDFDDATPTKIILESSAINWYVNGNHEMQLQSDGDLHVDADVIAFSTTTSDRKLKEDIHTIPEGLSKIQALRGVSYVWNAGSRKGQSDLGLIAQEVEKVIPEIVRSKKMPLLDGKEYKTIDYEKIIPLLIEGIKEQQTTIEDLHSRIKKLEND
jgi:hypothetical protein